MQQLRKVEAKRLFKKFPKRPYEVVLLLEDLQYARNVAGLFRTADAAGVARVYLTGISHKPPFGKELTQTSRNKEKSVVWKYEQDTSKILGELKSQGYYIIALEITDEGQLIYDLPQIIRGKKKICVVAGNEVHGVTRSTLSKCDTSVYIPMYGKGASLNVAVSAAITLFMI